MFVYIQIFDEKIKLMTFKFHYIPLYVGRLVNLEVHDSASLAFRICKLFQFPGFTVSCLLHTLVTYSLIQADEMHFVILRNGHNLLRNFKVHLS